MNPQPDRLYNLLPAYIGIRDVESGEPLRALLQVINDQVDLVEADIEQLYENWFIETCQEWVVPYIADLVGERLVPDAGPPGDPASREGLLRNHYLIPRRQMANTIGNRRRKGTLALLDELAAEVAGWPGRAVEFYHLLAVMQDLNHLNLDRGKTVDVRQGDALDRNGGPFDELAHTTDLRRPNSSRTPGRYNIRSVGLFAWRLNAYPIVNAPAACHCDISNDEDNDGNKYYFNSLGIHAQLFAKPVELPDRGHITDERNVPVPIRRRAFAERTADYYGPGKSLMIWRDSVPVPLEQIVAADLTDWHYVPRKDHVAVDPHLGLIVFDPASYPAEDVTVSYYYGFSAQIGGGGYPRPHRDKPTYRVGTGATFEELQDALKQWHDDGPDEAVIEIIDSDEYEGYLEVKMPPKKNLTIRAADGARPIIRLTPPHHRHHHHHRHHDAWLITGLPSDGNIGGRLTLEGLTVTGWNIHVQGSLTEVAFRDCTLVPGLALEVHCAPKHIEHPSLKVSDTTARVIVAKSILGPIQVEQSQVVEPVRVLLHDSILDALAPGHSAIYGDCPGGIAQADLTVRRCTVFGKIAVQLIVLAENSIFTGRVRAARSQKGCMRFCSVTPDSHTPRRYKCQPDGVLAALSLCANSTPADLDAAQRRVRPVFLSTRYGGPIYARLADCAAVEIRRGADDESEMGVFHDLFETPAHGQPSRPT